MRAIETIDYYGQMILVAAYAFGLVLYNQAPIMLLWTLLLLGGWQLISALIRLFGIKRLIRKRRIALLNYWWGVLTFFGIMTILVNFGPEDKQIWWWWIALAPMPIALYFFYHVRQLFKGRVPVRKGNFLPHLDY